MAAILLKPHFIFDSLTLPPKPTRHPSNPISISPNSGRRNLSNVPFPPHSRHLSSNSALGGMATLTPRSGPKGFEFEGCKAVSDGGSGGDGGVGGWGDGGSGGGDGTGNGDESGGDGWSFFKWYLMALDSYPVITKSITTCLLNMIGDLVCQLLIDRVPTLDLKRTSLFTFLGLVLVGPTLHFWYLSLSKLVTVSGAPGAILRLLLDQFIFSPVFIGVFLSSLVTLEGRPSLIRPKLEQEWFSSVLVNWQLWIPFQFLNFQFVPQKFQVLASNIVALAWNVILSFKAHKEVVLK